MANLVQKSNQREMILRLESQRLRRDLLAAQTLNQEYEALIASLFTALQSIQNSVCLNCKANVEKLVPPDLAVVADGIDSASLPRLPSLSQSDGPSHLPFWGQAFKGRDGDPSQSPTSDSARSPVARPESPKSNQGTSLLPNKITTVAPTHIPSSPPVPRDVSSIPRDEDTQPQPEWSVTINEESKPSLKVTFERAVTFEIEGSVPCVRFSSAGEYLAAGVNNDTGGWKVYIYDVQTGTKKYALVDPSLKTNLKPYLWSVCFSPNDQYLAIADSDKIWIWEFKTKLVRNTFKGHRGPVTFVDFSPDGRFLASSSDDHTVRIWSMRDGFSKIFEDNTQHCFYQVRFNLNGRYLAAANGDGMLRIWNTRTGQLMKWSAHGNLDLIRCVLFMPDDKGLISGGWDAKVKYWDISLPDQAESGEFEMKNVKNKGILKLSSRVGFVDSIDISSNGRWLVSGSFDPDVHIWDAVEGSLQFKLQGHRKRILSVDFSPTGEYLASGSADARLALWRCSGLHASSDLS